MYIFKISFTNQNPEYDKHSELVHDFYCYLVSLSKTGNIFKRNYYVVRHNSTYSTEVNCPEMISLNSENLFATAKHMHEHIEKESNSEINFEFIGLDSDSLPYDVSINPSHIILRDGWSSPLICGDTNRPFWRIKKHQLKMTKYKSN